MKKVAVVTGAWIGEATVRRLIEQGYTTYAAAGRLHRIANLEKLGVLISGRDQLRARMEHPAPRPDGSPGIPPAAAAWPVVTYDGPVTIHVNGEDVQLIPIRNAHTDCDTLVSFPRHDILAVGDYFRSLSPCRSGQWRIA